MDVVRKIEGIGRNKGNLRRLVEQLQTPQGVIPFVGAGLSIPLGFPGWTDFLLAEAESAGIRDKVQKLIDNGQYEEAAELLLDELGKRISTTPWRTPSAITGWRGWNWPGRCQ